MNRRRFTAGVLLGAVLSAAPEPASAGIIYGGTVTRAQVMARAHDWLRRRVRYSQDNGRGRWDVNRGRRYRPDCSGFVCMAWAVDPRNPRFGRALVTWELPRICTPVTWAGLQAGDILLRTRAGHHRRDHVRLFEAWLDPARTTASVIESSGEAGVVSRRTVTQLPRYRPYRYRNIA